MVKQSIWLSSASMALALAGLHGSALGQAQTGRAAETVVVTANKVQQRINDVAASVQAASGTELTNLGITDTSQLTKIVPGFTFTPSFYGTPIYAIRGVGFQDTSLAASPTVSVYQDEIPIPYSIMTAGAGLDVSRVEVLKGPQGVSFGSNATGGAINYIANKPSAEPTAGVTFSYGRFNTVDLQGYVGGPLADTLNYRLAARTLQSGPWQESYTRPDEWGKKNLFQGRFALEWMPEPEFTALLTISGFLDNSDTQMPALQDIAVLSPLSGLDPRIRNYPRAPLDNRAADWSACANASIFNEPFNTMPIGALRPTTAANCHAQDNDNDYLSVALRLDYDINEDITLTSLSSYQEFNRDTFIEGDGTIYQDYESRQTGEIRTWTQELRLAGDFGGTGNWVIGANYEHDATFDRFLQTYGGSTANPTALPGGSFCNNASDVYGPGLPNGAFDCAALGIDLAALAADGLPYVYLIPLGPTAPTNDQETESYAFFASGEYELSPEFSVEAGVRYTKTTKSSFGCGYDGGDGTWSNVSQNIQNLLQVIYGVIPLSQYLQPGAESGGLGIDRGPGACSTTGPGPVGSPGGVPGGQFEPDNFFDELEEDNVSWKIGLNWKPSEDTLVYANVKQGYKQGSYPTVATSAFTQLVPAVQEDLLAYEIGVKATLFDDTLQVNAAAFYYDYKDKQLLGAVIDPVFGPLPSLVNVPEAHVIGFELSMVWQPVEGLRIAPAVSYSRSEVDGCSGEDGPGPGCHGGDYFNYDPFSQLVNLTGQQFPSSPEWQGNVDVQYEWLLEGDMTAFIGGTFTYQGGAPGFFFNDAPFPASNAQPPDVLYVDPYALLDLRAGVQTEHWRVQLWGRNVTDTYYFNTSAHVNDVIVRYTGMPATYGFTVSYNY